MKTVTIEQAQKDLASLIRDAREGEPVEITDKGVPVAMLEGIVSSAARVDGPLQERTAAWRAFLDELGSQPVRNLGKFDRKKLYDELLNGR